MTIDGARRISRRVDVIRDGVAVAQLQTRREAPPEIAMSADAEIKMSMRGQFLKTDGIDYLTDLLRPCVIIDGEEYALGEYVIGTVQDHNDYGVTTTSIEAYDKSLILKQAAIESRFFIAAGTKYTDIIQQILIESGITKIMCDASADTLQTDREDWEIGTPYLTIVNALLSEINFNPLWFDLDGMARLNRYKQPSAENITHTYEAGAYSMLAKQCDSELDIFDAPNVFVAMVSSPDYETPMVATAVNENPSSALSTIRRGRRIVAPVMRLDNIASAEALQDYVDNVCAKSMLGTQTVTFYTAINPKHAVGDVVALKNESIPGIYQETEWSMTLEAGTMMTHRGKRVIYA